MVEWKAFFRYVIFMQQTLRLTPRNIHAAWKNHSNNAHYKPYVEAVRDEMKAFHAKA